MTPGQDPYRDPRDVRATLRSFYGHPLNAANLAESYGPESAAAFIHALHEPDVIERAALALGPDDSTASAYQQLPPPDLSGPSAVRVDGHVDPAAAARWHQAQTELAGLIREEARVGLDDPQAERVLPGSLGDWMAARVCELEEAEATEAEL